MKTNLFTLFIFLVVIALASVSCNKDDDPDNQADPWTLVQEEYIGNSGGVIDTNGIQFEVPAGVFDQSRKISLYISDQTVFGDNQASEVYEIRGLPEEFEGLIPVRIKAAAPLDDDFYIAVATMQYVPSLEDTVYVWTYLSAFDSSGFIKSTIKFVNQEKALKGGSSDPEFEHVWRGRVLVTIPARQGWYLTSGNHFKVTFSKPGITLAQATKLGEALETAWQKYKDMKFDYTSLESHYPIPVTYRPFQESSIPFLGDNMKNFGYYSGGRVFLTPSYDFNSIKCLAEENLIGPMAGHECFHMIQSLYHTNGELKNWLTEATATYAEELCSTGTGYIPDGFKSHWYRPLTGMQDGATFYDPAEDKVSSAFHGYGMSAIVKYFIENAKVENPLKVMIEAIHNDVHPVDAVFSVVPGENASSIWQMAMINYVSKTTYPMNGLHRAFIAGELYYTLNWAKSVTLSANLTDFPSATFNLPDLSATFVTISLDGNFDPEKEVFLNVTTIGEQEDINLYTWYYISKNSGETPLLNLPATGSTKLQSLKDNKYSIVVMITNARHVSPYTEKTHVTLNIRIKGPIAATTNPSNVTATTATLNGLINPNGEITSGTFEYGLTTSYGSTVQIAQNQLNGIEKIPVSADLSDLQPDKMYYFRLTASNQSGVATSEGSSFKTLKENTGPPTATTKAATDVTALTATLNGTVNPNGTQAGCSFEYGLTTAYGNMAPIYENPLNGNQSIEVHWELSGLVSGQTYHFRVNAYRQGFVDVAYGSDMTFTTVAGGLQLGQEYQGGIIFSLESNGLHGLIAAQSDQGLAEWGCYQTAISGADGMDIGTGSQNTGDIVSGCSTAGIAAALCDDLELNGYGDWFLPSAQELYKLLLEAEYGGYLGGFIEGGNYWSSSEYDANTAYQKQFGGMTFEPGSKNAAIAVRAIRSF